MKYTNIEGKTRMKDEKSKLIIRKEREKVGIRAERYSPKVKEWNEKGLDEGNKLMYEWEDEWK